MNEKQIELLIEKYLNGDTTLQEEALLKNYFTSDNVASNLQVYQSMFEYFTVKNSETSNSLVPLQKPASKYYWISGIAASIALLIGFLAIQNYQEQKQAEKAFADTKMAFELIGKQLNKGNQAIEKLGTIEQVKNKAFGNKLTISQ